jgi:hypothetical protein
MFMSEKVTLKNKYTMRERIKDLFVGKRVLDTMVCNHTGFF